MSNTKKAAPKIDRTIIVWNDKELFIRRLPECAAEAVCEAVRERMHAKRGKRFDPDEDPRWQIQEGALDLNTDGD